MIKKRRNDDKGGIKVYIVVNSNDIDPIMCSSNDKKNARAQHIRSRKNIRNCLRKYYSSKDTYLNSI